MPAGNRTGPWGFGPRTGRGRGFCSGFQAPGYMYPGPGLGYGGGFGLGRGFGRGMGRGRGFWRPRFGRFWGYSFSPVDEEAFLVGQAEALQAELRQIEARLKELKKAQEEKKK